MRFLLLLLNFVTQNGLGKGGCGNVLLCCEISLYHSNLYFSFHRL